MADTFQDFDTMQEFLSSKYYKQALEQFKASKAPKKEWEVVAFREGDVSYGCVYLLCDDGMYRLNGGNVIGQPLEVMLKDKNTIHSVRRLSDGEVFSVGDRIKPNPWTKADIKITGFSANGEVLRINNKDGYFLSGEQYWELMQKLPSPILVTHDGVEIFEGDEFWGVRDWRVLEGGKADKYDKNLDKAAPVFSTRSAAEEYILNHKPVLSLNDVREALPEQYWLSKATVIDRLTALVKEKINQ